MKPALTAKSAESVPSLNSFDIYSVLRENFEIFEAQKFTIAAISEDISELERFFQKKLVVVPFSMVCSETPLAILNKKYFIEWQSNDNEKFRLMCRVEWEIFEPCMSAPDVHVESKPLVEMPIAVRAALYTSLSRFIKEFADHLHKTTPEGVICLKNAPAEPSR